MPSQSRYAHTNLPNGADSLNTPANQSSNLPTSTSRHSNRGRSSEGPEITEILPGTMEWLEDEIRLANAGSAPQYRVREPRTGARERDHHRRQSERQPSAPNYERSGRNHPDDVRFRSHSRYPSTGAAAYGPSQRQHTYDYPPFHGSRGFPFEGPRRYGGHPPYEEYGGGYSGGSYVPLRSASFHPISSPRDFYPPSPSAGFRRPLPGGPASYWPMGSRGSSAYGSSRGHHHRGYDF